MPTSAQRIDLLFSSGSGYGWSESYWYLQTPLTAPNPPLPNLIAARASILGTDCAINFIRLATGYTRSPLLFDAAYPGFGAVGGTGGGTSGPDFVALVLRLQASPAGIGRLFLRGVPESQYVGDTISFDAGYYSNMVNFQNQLTFNDNWGVRTFTTNQPVVRYNATALLPVSPRGYSFTATTVPVGFGIGTTIVMHQCVSIGYNGRKKVVGFIAGSPNLITVGGVSPQQNEPGTNNPYFTVPPLNFNVQTSSNPERISRRAPGRFFGERRGRRSTILPLRR
jgi:hypothetical protein